MSNSGQAAFVQRRRRAGLCLNCETPAPFNNRTHRPMWRCHTHAARARAFQRTRRDTSTRRMRTYRVRQRQTRIVEQWFDRAHRYATQQAGSWPALYRDELISAGLDGLRTAAASFDPTRGVPFGAWMTCKVAGAVAHAGRTLCGTRRKYQIIFVPLDEAPDVA